MTTRPETRLAFFLSCILRHVTRDELETALQDADDLERMADVRPLDDSYCVRWATWLGRETT